MSDKELLEYIKNEKYLCIFCDGLKQEVLKRGLIAIDEYEGMICGGIEDMFIKRGKWKFLPKIKSKEINRLI